ncbi:MAG: TIGR01620 family protein [Pseudomonadota bacterium]
MRGPVRFEGEDLEGPAPKVEEAPPVPDLDAQTQPPPAIVRAVAGKGSSLGRLIWAALGGLVLMAMSFAVWDLVASALARSPLLGSLALGLAGVLLVGLVILALREALAFFRLRRIGDLQRRAADPEAREDRATALSVAEDLMTLYAARDELRLPVQDLQGRLPDILDADAVLAQAEMRLMEPLDQQARREVEAAARQVAAATAIVPLALVDVAVTLAANLRMIRRIAEIYGGRGGTFGAWRLVRAVARHLVATGVVAVGDDFVGSVVGGGALAKVSRRFGEGVINGALTARVGIAAMEVCRPLPFAALPRPRTTRLVQRALTGLFGRSA